MSAGRLDRAKVFMEAGLNFVERLIANPEGLGKIGDGVGILFVIPPNALAALFAAGVDEVRYKLVARQVLSQLKAR